MTTESNKQKIAKIHDIFPLATKDQIEKVLQYYDDDESLALDAITRDGGREALSNWAESVNAKSKNNKNNNKKKKGKKEPGLAGSATASFDADDSSSLHSSGNVDTEIERECPIAESRNDLLISSLSEDFKNLYINRRCTDVTLIVKDKEFYAHKTVLIARSSVFASMFEHNLSEKSSEKVDIPDCDPSSFEKFLIFLYTDKLDNISLKAAMDLYTTADKYDVRTVKLECVRIMRRDLCVDFFCDAIHLAMMYMESDLLRDATNFFIDNAEAILLTTKWQQFLEENSSLCNELLLKLLRSKKLRKDKI